MKYKYKGFAVCDMCGTKNNPDYDDCWWCNENKSKIERIFTQQRTEQLEEIKKLELKLNPNSPSRERKIIYNEAIKDVINLMEK